MGDFEKIIKAAKDVDELVLEQKIQEEAQIRELRDHNKQKSTYGKSKMLASKEQLNQLSEAMEHVATSFDFKMFDSVKNVESEDELPEEKDKLLFRLKQNMDAFYQLNKNYTDIKDGFDRTNLNHTIRHEQEAFSEALTGIEKIDSIFDELMKEDVSDSKDFDSLYVAYNNIKKRYSDIAQGSMNIIQDSYYAGQKVYKINGKNPKTDTALKKYNTGKTKFKAEWIKETEPLFSHDPCPEDVMQGTVGDCYLVSALAAIAAQNPDRIREMIKLKHIKEKDPSDPSKTKESTVAVVRLYTTKNEPVDVTVPYSSCYLTTMDNGNRVGKPLYSGGATWVKMIEKALVASGLATEKSDDFNAALSGKYNPDYSSIAGGHSHEVMQTLLGPEMAKTYDGEAFIGNNSVNTPANYDDILTEMANKKNRIQNKANADIKLNNEKLVNTMLKINKDVNVNGVIELVEGLDKDNLGKYIDESLANPEKAKDYFVKGTSQKAQDPLEYFQTASSAKKRYEKALKSAYDSLAPYDKAKTGRPENFPDEYHEKEKKLFSDLKAAFDAGQALAAATPDMGEEGDTQYGGKAAGLPFKHAYSITNVYEKDGICYVEVKNPHNAGTRQYDEKGQAYHDPDTSKMGYSQVEFRDFCQTFGTVYFGKYDPRPSYQIKTDARKETMDLYGDALKGACNIINKCDTFKQSPEFNTLRSAAKDLLAKLKDEKVDNTDLDESIDEFFRAADVYKKHRDAETAERTRNKEIAANRYIASDIALRIRDIRTANNLPDAEKKAAYFEDIRKETMTVQPGDSVARKASVNLVKGIEDAAKAKADAAIKNAETKLETDAKAMLSKALDKRDEKNIIKAVSTLIYLEDVKAKAPNLSQKVLADKYTPAEVKRGTDLMNNSVSEALGTILKDKGSAEAFVEAFKTNDPVKMIKDVWEAQLRQKHPDAFKEAAPDQVTGLNVQNKNKEKEPEGPQLL